MKYVYSISKRGIIGRYTAHNVGGTYIIKPDRAVKWWPVYWFWVAVWTVQFFINPQHNPRSK